MSKHRGIICPACGAKLNKVKRTREGYGVIRRQRPCSKCSHVEPTEERSPNDKAALVRLGGITIADLLRLAGFTDSVSFPSVKLRVGETHGPHTPSTD